ncbi:hypothetical protein [Pedobacter miscanthi]|nr:hypothetical protein [Pedobacter miscanthi]
MKKILVVMMMCLMGVGAFAKKGYLALKQCTVHYSVVDEDGGAVWGPADVTSDTCEHAVKTARYFYFLATGDSSVF